MRKRDSNGLSMLGGFEGHVSLVTGAGASLCLRRERAEPMFPLHSLGAPGPAHR